MSRPWNPAADRALTPLAPPPLRALWTRWQSIAETRPPAPDDFSFESLVAERPGLALIEPTGDLVDGRMDYRFRAVGPAHRARTGVDLEMRRISELIHPGLLDVVLDAYDALFTGGAPHYWEFANAVHGAPYDSYERVLLPLFDAEGRVRLAIGEWIWRDL